MTSTNLHRELKLHSPAGIEAAVFAWPNIDRQKSAKDAVFIGGDEIVQTIRFVFEDHPELYQQNLALDSCDIYSYSNMKELCDKFNKIIDTHLKLNRGTEAFSARLEQRATSKLFRHIFAQVYSRSITDPEKLRNYEPFSPSVYGETSPDLIDSILKVIDLTEDQTFLDLGSGVGNVVLHVSALASCKHVYGIEYEETPAAYACAMADEFRFWMNWYGKRYSDFQLDQGDFLNHPTIDERIREADVIFVNNYVFGSTVNHELKIKFTNMKDGAKIISSREFCPETFRLNDRTRNELGAVMHITKPEEFFGKVSWSDKSVQYYFHVIDHSKLAHYYEKTHELNTKGTKPAHSKLSSDDRSMSSSSTASSLIDPSTSSKTKSNENRVPSHRSKQTKRKHTRSANLASARVRKRHSKASSNQDSDFDTDVTNDSYASDSKRHRSSLSNDCESILTDLQTASNKFIQSDQNRTMENAPFNYQAMTKLSHDNLRRTHFHEHTFEQEDQQFFNAINSYLEQFRQRLFTYFTYMKSDIYREHLRKQLNNEMELNQTLKVKVNGLENNIKALLEDAMHFLKSRTNELGIDDLERPEQLITYASDISNKHKELRLKVASLEKEIEDYDQENDKISSILTNIQRSEHQPVSHAGDSIGDDTYSTLLARMSKQTRQQETGKRVHSSELLLTAVKPLSHSLWSPNVLLDKASSLSGLNVIATSNQRSQTAYDLAESERRTDFVIRKRPKKLDPVGLGAQNVISPVPMAPSVGQHSNRQDSSSSAAINNIGNLLSTKQLEPLQVHSIASMGKHSIKPQKSPTKMVTGRPGSHTSPPSSTIKRSHKADRISDDLAMESPRKKRDFYGKSSGSSTSPVPNHRSHRHSNKMGGLPTAKDRPSSTPARPTAIPSAVLFERPVSIPPLRVPAESD